MSVIFSTRKFTQLRTKSLPNMARFSHSSEFSLDLSIWGMYGNALSAYHAHVVLHVVTFIVDMRELVHLSLSSLGHPVRWKACKIMQSCDIKAVRCWS